MPKRLITKKNVDGFSESLKGATLKFGRMAPDLKLAVTAVLSR